MAAKSWESAAFHPGKRTSGPSIPDTTCATTSHTNAILPPDRKKDSSSVSSPPPAPASPASSASPPSDALETPLSSASSMTCREWQAAALYEAVAGTALLQTQQNEILLCVQKHHVRGPLVSSATSFWVGNGFTL